MCVKKSLALNLNEVHHTPKLTPFFAKVKYSKKNSASFTACVHLNRQDHPQKGFNEHLRRPTTRLSIGAKPLPYVHYKQNKAPFLLGTGLSLTQKPSLSSVSIRLYLWLLLAFKYESLHCAPPKPPLSPPLA